MLLDFSTDGVNNLKLKHSQTKQLTHHRHPYPKSSETSPEKDGHYKFEIHPQYQQRDIHHLD